MRFSKMKVLVFLLSIFGPMLSSSWAQLSFFYPNNARVDGLGGAGVALVSVDGQAPIHLNPATLAYVEESPAFTFSLARHSISASDMNLGSAWGFAAEGVFPLSILNVLGSFRYFTGEGSSGLFLEAGSAKKFLDDQFATGGTLLFWRGSEKFGEPGFERSISLSGFVARLGTLYRNSAGWSVGAALNTESTATTLFVDDFFDTWVMSAVFPSTLRMGGAYQEEDALWAAGADAQIALTSGEMNQYSGFMEYNYAENYTARGGVGLVSASGSTGFLASLGAGVQPTEGLYIDLFVKNVSISSVNYFTFGLGSSYWP